VRNRADVAILIVALVLFSVIAWLRATAPQARASFPSTYDTGANGYAALFEFLQREQVDAKRYELPLGELPAGGTIVFAGEYAIDPSPFSAKASTALEKWVRRGGKLIVLGNMFPLTRDALGLPKTRSAATKRVWTGCGFRGKRLAARGEFALSLRVGCDRKHSVLLQGRGGAVAVSLKHGRGSIVDVVSPSPFDNAHLALRDNAAFAYDLFGGGAPMFDERVYGYATGRTFWEVMPRAVIWAVVLALLGVLLAIVAANVRLAPARALERDDERDSFAYIESLARMLQRGGAAHDIIARLAQAAGAFRSPAAGDDRGRAAFETLRGLAQRSDAGPREVLAAGTIFAQLRKDYEW
jgi:uncharacterized protein DUF4350